VNTVDVEITIQRKQRSKAGQGERGPKSDAVPRIPRITRLMALAIKFQDMVDSSEVRDYADLARLGFVTRARMTQIMNLLNLAPDIQEQLLVGPALCDVRETHLRPLVKIPCWRDQRYQWSRIWPMPAVSVTKKEAAE
jgi:hypothetical protein